MYQAVSKYRNGNVFKISSGFPKQFKNNYVAIHRHMFSNSLYGKRMNVNLVSFKISIKTVPLKKQAIQCLINHFKFMYCSILFI